MEKIQRRSFLKKSATAVAAGTLATVVPTSVQAEEKKAKIVVVHGTDIPKMIEAGIEKMGGWGKFIKEGSKVSLKPNLAWSVTPEQGGNTHPDIIRAVILAAEKAKAKQILIPENTCESEKKTFPVCGIYDAIKGTSAVLTRPKRNDYMDVEVPKGKVCKKARVTRALVEADCLINMPVAKHHGGATLTISMKNWMGAVDNGTRQWWHRAGLHQCIADFSTYLKASLIIIDATRILLEKGPRGPGKLAHPHEIIFATDPVAADAYAATLFVKAGMKFQNKPLTAPKDVGYIKIAEELGVGCADLSKVDIVRVEV